MSYAASNAANHTRVLESNRIISLIRIITLERLDSLKRWLTSHSSGRRFTLAPASADASFRRYFRVRFEDESTLIAMDAPPQQEDSAPFVRVAHMMAECGLHVPEIIACDLEQGFILLSDLGQTTYLSALDESTADDLFDDATTALTRWQLASRDDTLPPYDDKLLWRELDLFPHWYVSKHLGVIMDTSQRETLHAIFELIVKNNLSQPPTYVHRDYMPRNLMVSDPNPGILDFQDAVYGPITYDVVSLFRDAFISWDEERVLDWVVRYWEKARKARLPVRADFGEFYRELEWMGLQRHLKVLGIFARIRYRDGKPAYLEDAPRFLGYIRSVAQRYTALAPLLKLFDQLDDQVAQTGHRT
jgi:aminoglycoside/choline kinase family phosphotransferase